MIGFVAALYLAVAVGHAVWISNLFRVSPWKDRLEQLRGESGPNLAVSFVIVFGLAALGWPIAWPWMAWNVHHDDGQVP